MNKRIYLVERKHLANEIGSGTMPVLATPALIAFFENAACELLQKHLSEGLTSVGTFVGMKHLKPSLIEDKISIETIITQQTEKQAEFSAQAYNEQGLLIGEAVHKRAIVHQVSFQEKYHIN